MNKFTKKIVVGALALMAVMSMTLSVSATPTPQATPPALQSNTEKAIIQKVFQIPVGVDLTDDEFGFEFEAKGLLDDKGVLLASGDKDYIDPTTMPVLGTAGVVTIDTFLLDSIVNGYQIFKGDIDALAGVATTEWEHAGVYLYHIKEVVPVSTDPLYNPNMVYSIAEYDMYVYVVNDDLVEETLKVRDVGFRITKNERPNLAQPVITPLPTVTPTQVPGANTSAPKDNPVFTNRYTPPVDLEIMKDVAGDFADTTKYFEYTLVINRPQAAADLSTGEENYYGAIFSAYSQESPPIILDTVTVTFAQGATLGVVTSTTITGTQNGTFLLKHGQVLDFYRQDGEIDPGERTGLPAGSTYTLTETGTPGYTATAYIFNNDLYSITETKVGTRGDSLTADGTGNPLEALTLGDKSNGIDWENEYQTITPTGILLDNLPFILLILVAVCGLVGSIAIRRKRAKK